MVVRHGSRYPSLKQAKRSIDFLATLRRNSFNETYVEKILNEIDETTFKDKPHYGLTNVGGQEQREIGDRFRRRYFDLIQNTHLNDISFISSSKPRSIESGRNFSYHLFLDRFTNNAFTFDEYLNALEINDEMMRGFDTCKVYLDKISNNLESSKEYDLFREQEIVKNLVKNFKKMHFISDDFPIDVGES